MSDNGMPKFRGSLPKPLDLAQKYQFDQDAEFVAAYLLEGDGVGKRTIIRRDKPFVCKIDLVLRRAGLQHVIDVTMSLVDDAGQPKETPEKVAEIRLNPEAARVCRAELHVARSVFMVYNRFLDWLWLEEFIAGWRVREIKQAKPEQSKQGFMVPTKEQVEPKYRSDYRPAHAQRLADNIATWYEESQRKWEDWTIAFIAAKLNLNSTDTGRIINALRVFTPDGAINGVPLPPDRRRKK